MRPLFAKRKQAIPTPVAQAPAIAQPAPATAFTKASPAMTNDNTLYTGSQLGRQQFTEFADLVDAIDIVFCSDSVQRAAAAAHAKLAVLYELIGLRSEIARGVDNAMGSDHDITKISPTSVIEAINRRTAEIDDAIASAKADKIAHNATNKARAYRLKTLNDAVNRVSASLTAERAGLVLKIDASKLTDSDANEKRVRQLREAGLTLDQINGLTEPIAMDRAATVQAARARIVEINTLLPKCKAFWDDPWRRTAVLTGLGLDVEIEAFEAARREPYTTEAVQA